MGKTVKILAFPWPPGPGEVKELRLGLKEIRAHVQGEFEAHTLSNGCMVYCNDEGRELFKGEPYLFPYTAFNLPVGSGGFAVHMFPSYDAMLNHPRVQSEIDVRGPCLVVGPADEDGNETSVSDEAIELLQKAFQGGAV